MQFIYCNEVQFIKLNKQRHHLSKYNCSYYGKMLETEIMLKAAIS